MPDTVHVKIEGGGLLLNREVTPEQANKIVIFLLSEDLPQGAVAPAIGLQGAFAQSSGQAAPADGAPRRSIREHFDHYKVTDNAGRIAAIGTYHLEQDGRKTFTDEDIRQGFMDASELVPKNLPRDVNRAKGFAYIATSPDGKSYYVTDTGKKFLAALAVGESVTRAAPRRRPTRKRSKATAVAT